MRRGSGPNIGGPSCGYLPEPEEPEEGKAASETDGKAAAAGDASVEEEKAEEEDEVHQVGWQELLDEFVTCATAVPESEAAAPSSRGSQRSGGSARAESPKHSDQRSDSGLFAAVRDELPHIRAFFGRAVRANRKSCCRCLLPPFPPSPNAGID